MECSFSCHTFRLTNLEESEPDLSNVQPGVDVLNAIISGFAAKTGSLYQPGRLRTLDDEAEEDDSGPYVAYKLEAAITDLGGRVIKGVIQRGDCGKDKTIFNTQTSEIDFRQVKVHCDFSPLHYFIWVPKGKHTGFVFCQKVGIMSCQGAIHYAMDRSVIEAKCKHKLFIRPFLPDGWIQKYIEKSTAKSFTTEIFLSQLPAEQKAIFSKFYGSNAKMVITPSARNVRYVLKDVTKAIKKMKSFRSNTQNMNAGSFASENPFGQTELTLDIGDGKSRKWVHGSNDFSYPVVFFNDAVYSGGHVSADYFYSKCEELLVECKESIYGEM
ncbi:MAG: hypothetical protein KF836_08160 [Fimbriimonadaceae bacterium]|nr:hypothetical protein [Fimbriimonadaceae bacterium]